MFASLPCTFALPHFSVYKLHPYILYGLWDGIEKPACVFIVVAVYGQARANFNILIIESNEKYNCTGKFLQLRFKPIGGKNARKSVQLYKMHRHKCWKQENGTYTAENKVIGSGEGGGKNNCFHFNCFVSLQWLVRQRKDKSIILLCRKKNVLIRQHSRDKILLVWYRSGLSRGICACPDVFKTCTRSQQDKKKNICNSVSSY